MNAVALEALARQILPVIGTLLTVLGFKNATTYIDTLMQIIGPIMVVASAIWSMFRNTTSSIISKAANLPEVKSVELTSQAPNSLVASTPDNVTK